MQQGRPRKHDFNIPKGLPQQLYKRVLRVEERLDREESAREDYLVSVIKDATKEMKRLAREVGRIKTMPPNGYELLARMAALVKHHNNKKKRAKCGKLVEIFISEPIDNTK